MRPRATDAARSAISSRRWTRACKARRALELDLRNALANDEFELHYQPLVNLERNEICSCEALLRWHHPERGMISPAEFIPVAEETGLIVAIGEWVLRTACAEAATWPDDVTVAVNVSPVQFKKQTLVLTVVGALAASGLSARRLAIEITEAVLMRDNEATLATLHQLRDLGVRIVMDDFGTGYSSLSYLRSFPFDKIKIDRSFINDVSDMGDASAIVQATTSLAGTHEHDDDRRGRRNPGTAGDDSRVGLHRNAGLSVQPPEVRRGHRPVVPVARRCAGQRGVTVRRRSTAKSRVRPTVPDNSVRCLALRMRSRSLVSV